jgi:hypothetical protein
MPAPTVSFDPALAPRLAAAAAALDGVRSALVCDADGSALGASGSSDPPREAALASFVALRAEALPVDGDLRGMGRQLAGSRLDHVLIAGPGVSETLICPVDGRTYLSLLTSAGRATAVLPSVAQLLRRLALASNPASRS